MSAIENEAWVEAVARELCEADGGTSRGAAHAWKAYRSLARGAIRALDPLIIERCAEVAGKHIPKDDEWNDSASSGCRAFLEGCKFTADNISKDIRALIQKEASDGQPV